MTRRTMFVARRHRCRLLLVVALVAGLCPIAWADPVAPGPSDRQIAIAVTSLVSRQHLSRHPLDKEISERCLKTFLRSLDPMKLHFYQSDIDEFMKHKDELASAARKGNVDFAYTVFHRFLQRVDERVKTVDELLAMPHDFTIDEQMVADRDLAQYPHDAAEARERWRKRIKYDLLMLEADKKEGQEARDKLTRRYHSFAKRRHQTSGDDLLEMYLNALTRSFDPHTSYMSPATQEDFQIAMSLKLDGIGALLMSEDGYTSVKQIIRDGPADKDGRLQPEDKIVGVGQGEEGEMVDVVDMRLRDVVKLIRGTRDTVVRLEVVPADVAETKVYKITRKTVELKDREAKGKVFEAGRKSDGTPYRIGVIDLPSFYHGMEDDRRGVRNFRSTTDDVRKILEDFNRENVDAVVLDLRANGGGLLNEAISLTGLFINEGPVVQLKDADEQIHPLNDPDSGMVWSGPLVVLISKFSASASEILAGAIQDYNRGLIVGDRATHGKGTVQSLMDLGQRLFGMPNSWGALKITMQQFYRPSGDSTQQRGVLADIELPSIYTHLDVGEADLDYPLAFDSVKPLRYTHFNYVTPAICDQLRQLSQQRVTPSEEFQKVLRKIARYKEQKAKKYVTLNEEEFLKERAEINADKEEEDAIVKHSELNKGEIERNYYLDEALAITADYLDFQHVANAQSVGLGARD